MKKVYFAGKFNKSPDFEKDMVKGLKNDFRAILLGDAAKMVYADDNVKINSQYNYVGPFWCERAPDGTVSATDCDTVISGESREVSICDMFVVVFDEGFAPGAIVELGWALNHNKEIYILYKIQDSVHQIKSEHWFAIADAMRRDKNVRVFPYNNSNEVLPIINNILTKRSQNEIQRI